MFRDRSLHVGKLILPWESASVLVLAARAQQRDYAPDYAVRLGVQESTKALGPHSLGNG